MEKESNIFDRSGCLTDRGLMLYIRNELSARDKEQVEQHIAHCEMCTDALEGLKLSTISNVENIVSEINTNIDSIVERRARKNNTKWYYAAACIILLIGIGSFWIISLQEAKQEKRMAVSNDTQVMSDKTALRDSISTEIQAASAPKTKHADKSTYKQAAEEVALPRSDADNTDALAIAELQKMDQKPKAKARITNDLKETEVVAYKVPVIAKDNSAMGATITREALADAEYQKPAPAMNTTGSSIQNNITQAREFDISGMIAFAESAVNNKDEAKQEMEAIENVGYAVAKSEDRQSSGKKKAMRSEAPVAAPESNVSFEEGVNLYKHKEYIKANAAFEKIIKTNPNNDRAEVYSVLAKINMNETDNALKKIEVIKRKDIYTAKYLEAIVLLKENKQQMAIILLQELSSINNRYKTKAQEILLKLK